MKERLVLIMLVLIFGAGMITASVSSQGEPFKAIWNAIHNLQDQIDELNSDANSCPEEMVKINDYCIYKNANGEQTFSYYEGVKLCGDAGKRLCQPQEWLYACQIRAINFSTGYDFFEVGGRFYNDEGFCPPPPNVTHFADWGGYDAHEEIGSFRCCMDN